jgi:uncharacterized phage protein
MSKRKIRRTCPDCWGTGRHWDKGWRKCARCNGTGRVETEVEVNDGR